MGDDLKVTAMMVALAAGLLVGSASEALAARCSLILGAAENPPVVSDGTGRFRILRPDPDTLEYLLTYDIPGAGVIQAHIHIANPGINGGIAAFLCTNLDPAGPACGSPTDTIEGEIVADDVLEVPGIIEAGDLDGLFKLIRDGATYVNVHTTDHEAGEIRCQINPRLR